MIDILKEWITYTDLNSFMKKLLKYSWTQNQRKIGEYYVKYRRTYQRQS